MSLFPPSWKIVFVSPAHNITIQAEVKIKLELKHYMDIKVQFLPLSLGSSIACGVENFNGV